MDHFPGYAWIKDTAGRYVYLNKRLCQLPVFQVDRLGQTDEDLWQPELAAEYRANDLKVIATGEKVETIESLVLDGEQRYLLVTKFPILDKNGSIIMVGGTSIDVTEHRRAEEALRESESFRRMIVESEPECVKLVAPDFTLLDINPAGLGMIGATSREQVIGHSVLDLIAPEWRGTFTTMHERVCRGESVVAEFEIISLEGSRRCVESHAAPLHDRGSGMIAHLAVARDITERKQAEAAMRASQQQYETLVQSIDGIVWEVDAENFQFVFVSNQAERILGYPVEKWLEPNFWADHLHPDDRDRAVRSCLDATSRKADHQMEYRMVAADGRVIWLRDIVTVTESDDHRLRLSGIMVDLTERKREEQALRAAEQKYRDIFENAVGGIFQASPEGHFIAANPALVKMFGFNSLEELIRERVDISRQIYEELDRREEFKGVPDDDGVVRAIEHQVFRKDGSKIWITVNARSVRGENGEILYYEGTAQDITDRKSAEQRLRESEERYRELFENAKDAIYVHDLDGRYTSVNRAAEKISGFTREEILGKTFSDFVPAEQAQMIRDQLCRKLAEEGETTYESEVINREGRRIPIEVSSHLIYENGVGIGVQGTVRDITERKRADAALRNYSRLLIEAQETERQNIARELHDQIGQILTAIRINLQTIWKSCETAESRLLIDEGVGMVDQALEQVRDLSFELRPSILDDLGLIAALRWFADRYSRRTGIRTKMVIDPSVRQIRLRKELETACFRIVQEALTNVARHSHARDVSILLKVVNHEIVVSIEDNGCGFDVNAPDAGSAGISLGLSGMRERALAVGGRVVIKSAPAQGTRIFLFMIP